jgi:hypothetical protein
VDPGRIIEVGEGIALFVWLISHQPAVFFSHNKPTISNQPTVLISQTTSTSHQPPAKRTGCKMGYAVVK